MKKLLTLISLIPALLFGQTPTMRQVASAGTATTRLPLSSGTSTAINDTVIAFTGGAWIKVSRQKFQNIVGNTTYTITGNENKLNFGNARRVVTGNDTLNVNGSAIFTTNGDYDNTCAGDRHETISGAETYSATSCYMNTDTYFNVFAHASGVQLIAYTDVQLNPNQSGGNYGVLCYGNIYPGVDDSYMNGYPSARWRSLYVDSIPGDVIAKTQSPGDNSNKIATTAYVASASTGGTVTSYTVATANGVSATVTNNTTTPVATYSLGAITPSSVSTNTFTLGGVTTTTTTGTGAVVLGTNATLTTPNIGVATATSVNKYTWVAPATSATVAVTDGKRLSVANTLTFSGTDATAFTFPVSSGTVVTTGTATRVVAATTFSVSASLLLSGFTGALTYDFAEYSVIGDQLTIRLYVLGTGTGVACSLVLPNSYHVSTNLDGAGTRRYLGLIECQDNGANAVGWWIMVPGDDHIYFRPTITTTNFTDATTRGLFGSITLTIQ